MKRKKHFFSSALIVMMTFSMLFGLTGCNSSAPKSQKPDEKGEYVVIDGVKTESSYIIKINGNEVSPALYRYYFLGAKNSFSNDSDEYWKNNPEAEKQLKDKVLTYIKSDFAVKEIAKKEGIELTEDDKIKVETQMNELKTNYETSGGDYYKTMNEYYMTEEVYRQLLINEMLQAKIQEKLFNENGKNFISDEDLISVIKSDEYIRTLSVQIAPDINEETTNQKIADEVLKKAKEGTDFYSLIQEYGSDEGMKDNKDGYYFKKGDIMAPYENAAFELNIDEISDIIKTEYGYYIIKRLEKEDEYINANIESLKSDYYSILYSKMVVEESNILEIEYFPDYDKIGINEVK